MIKISTIPTTTIQRIAERWLPNRYWVIGDRSNAVELAVLVQQGKSWFDKQMKHTNLQASPHLQAERDRLLDLIDQVRHSGSVAPAYCWVTTHSETRDAKTYQYAKLWTRQPNQRQPTVRSLGKPGSARHRAWARSLARREAIAELEQQLSVIEALCDRQVERAAIVEAWEPEPVEEV